MMKATGREAGILPVQAIRGLIEAGQVKLAQPPLANQLQPASLDLRLGGQAFRVRASFLPGSDTVAAKLRDLHLHTIDLSKSAVLETGCVYIVPLLESMALPPELAAATNPKSSTGRLDILTRLIADEATRFDQVEEGYEGQLYLEVAPRSFSVVVRTGTRLNQLRFRRTRGENPKPITVADWRALLMEGQIADSTAMTEKTGNLPFTIDLKGSGSEDALIGWRAKKHTRRIDLEFRSYDPFDFWEPIRFRKDSSLILDPDEFYILMTKEAIAVPPEFAAEMLPYDTRAGEFRVHYAGFFDPGFGWDARTRRAGSSRGVLEVRSHEVPFLLEHGQTIGWLRYERMAERPDMLYGNDIASNYQGQQLKLAKQFRPLAT